MYLATPSVRFPLLCKRLENPAGMAKSLWCLHLPTGRVEKVADTRLFNDPFSFRKP
ncbi:MAG: hypothetical protein N2045_01635 [Fimbriimonadales bacterium]|jgi:hypothetical protein|nr:hypothetical protein [Fimbriimonadales bacterium]GBC89579.1 hypothetical protein HRbin14_00305 [bacterium HR14]GIV12651.1 MAG: hypothetical protein KatS3mg021_0933 [Fimbriimonadales bacterium]CUU38750.1 hypothetical protein GXSOP10_143114 [Armatimonadetes bacterium GXS]